MLRHALIAALAWGALGAPEALAQTRDDTQLWTGVEGEVEVSKRLDLEVEQQLRVGSNAGFDKTFTQVSADVELNKYVDAGAHYRFIVLDGETRHRVGGDVSVGYRFGRLKPSYRFRLQATTRSGDSTSVPIRNRIKLELDLPHKLEPYVSLEIHVQLSPATEYRERRFAAGLTWEATKRVSLDGFILSLEESNVNMPDSFLVFGVSASVKVRELD